MMALYECRRGDMMEKKVMTGISTNLKRLVCEVPCSIVSLHPLM